MASVLVQLHHGLTNGCRNGLFSLLHRFLQFRVTISDLCIEGFGSHRIIKLFMFFTINRKDFSWFLRLAKVFLKLFLHSLQKGSH